MSLPLVAAGVCVHAASQPAIWISVNRPTGAATADTRQLAQGHQDGEDDRPHQPNHNHQGRLDWSVRREREKEDRRPMDYSNCRDVMIDRGVLHYVHAAKICSYRVVIRLEFNNSPLDCRMSKWPMGSRLQCCHYHWPNSLNSLISIIYIAKMKLIQGLWFFFSLNSMCANQCSHSIPDCTVEKWGTTWGIQ